MTDYIQAAWDALWSVPRSILPGVTRARFDDFTPVVLLTGCDSGIGALTYEALRDRGFEVIGVYERDSSRERLSREVQLAVKCDISKLEEIEDLRRRVEIFLRGNPRRKLWAVINNASSNMLAPIDWVPVSEFERLMQVNYMGVVRMTKCFLPLLKETKGSRIINVASALGHLSVASFGAYAPTKAAVQSFTKTLSLEMAQFGVYACIVNPIQMDTPMIRRAGEGMRQLYEDLSPELKAQYPRDKANRYIENFTNTVQASAQDPDVVARTLLLATEQAVPKFEYMAGYGSSATWAWKHLVPLGVEEVLYRTKSVAIPSAKSPREEQTPTAAPG